MEVLEMKIDESKGLDGVFAVSNVTYPAMEDEFILLSAEEFDNEIQLEVVNEDQRILMGAVMIPEKRIPRKAKDGSTYAIYFTAETIKQAAELYFKNNYQNETTNQHKSKVDNVVTFESWIVEDSKIDKSALYGKNYPVGTWVLSRKVNDDETWKEAKEGRIRGFSIEALFNPVRTNTNLEKIKQILSKIQ